MSQILRDVPYAIVTLLVYESLHRIHRRATEGKTPTPFVNSVRNA
jgi:hypothetical protein